MPAKIRLARHGRKKQPIYNIVVADSRAPRDGKFIEKLGTYNPNTNPATIILDEEKAFNWVMNGAQPTETVKAMLSYRGILLKKHLQIGVIKGAISQDVADKKFEDWKNNKDSKIVAKGDSVAKAKADAKATALAAETKKKEARQEAINAKSVAAEAPAVEEAAPEAEAPSEESAE